MSSVDGNANQDKNGVTQDAEIHFTAETLLNNAINLGFYAELNAVGYADTAIGNIYAYADGAFGRFMIGAINPAATLGAVKAPNFVAGLNMWDNTVTEKFIQNSLSTPNSLNAPNHAITTVHMTTYEEFFSHKEKKIVYFTPRISGIRAGISHAASNEKGNGLSAPASIIGQEDIYSYSVDYKRSLPYDISFAVSFGLTKANNGPGKAALIGWTLSDPETRDIGLRTSYRDVTFAVRQTSYDNYEGDTNRDIKTVNYTVSYNLNNATLGYSLNPQSIGLGDFVSNIRLSLTGQNLFVISDYSGFDPEVNTGNSLGGVQTFGIDRFTYPMPRTILFGLNASF